MSRCPGARGISHRRTPAAGERGREQFGAYIACERCGRVTSVEPAKLDSVRRTIHRKFGYEARFSHFPILGLCRSCAEEGRARTEARGADEMHHHDEHEHGHDQPHSHRHSHGDEEHEHAHTTHNHEHTQHEHEHSHGDYVHSHSHVHEKGLEEDHEHGHDRPS